MRTRPWLIVGLVLVNVALAGPLATRGWRDSVAYGQARPRIDPITASANFNGTLVLYTLDVTSGRMVATKVDVQRKEASTAATTNVKLDLQRAIPK